MDPLTAKPPLVESVGVSKRFGATEALRNVQRHAHASRVRVSLVSTRDGIRLAVVDDGVGFTAEERRVRGEEGHVGLSLLEELVSGSGGTLEVSSTPGEGATVTLELPSR